MSIRTDNRRPPAKAPKHACHSRAIIRFNDKRNLLNDFDTPPKIAGDLSAPNAASAEQEFLNRSPEIVRSINQHGVRLGESLPNMLRHAQTKHFLNLAGRQLFFKGLYR